MIDTKWPDWLILGGMKCGTTSLWRWLQQHPQITTAKMKEVSFWCGTHWHNGPRWYRNFFHGDCAGEATPFYLFHPAAPPWIADLIPDVKLIVLMRNPIDRAYSHWIHECWEGYEPLTFEGSIFRELRKEARDLRHQSYLARGRYAQQLKRWFHWLPADQFCLIRSEDMREAPGRVYHRVCAFLGVDLWDGANLSNEYVRQYPPMSDEIRHKLRNYFEPHNQELYELLDVDYGWA